VAQASYHGGRSLNLRDRTRRRHSRTLAHLSVSQRERGTFGVVGFACSAGLRFLVATIAVAVVAIGCGGSRPAERHFVSAQLLKRGMTFARAQQLAGPPHKVIRRPELVRSNGEDSPFSQVWVYTEPKPSTAATYVYFSRTGRVLAVLRSTGKPVSF